MSENNKINEIEKRLDLVEQEEKRIEAEEAKILSADQHILSSIEDSKANSSFLLSIYKFRFWLSILLTVGVVLVWKGIGELSNDIPIVSTAVGALAVGLLTLWLIDLLTRKGR